MIFLGIVTILVALVFTYLTVQTWGPGYWQTGLFLSLAIFFFETGQSMLRSKSAFFVSKLVNFGSAWFYRARYGADANKLTKYISKGKKWD